MKLLITGANGQVGSELVSIARDKGYEVIAAARDELDVTKRDDVLTYTLNHQPDLIINAAAYTAVDIAENEQELAYAINQDGAENLANACSHLSIPLFHISTDYVFDGTNPDAYLETDNVSPLGIYGKSKFNGEESIRTSLEHHIILRVAWVFGGNGKNFVKTMLRLGCERDELTIVADQFGGPTPAKAIADTLLKLVGFYTKNKSLEWGTYHYCGSPKVSWYDFAKEIIEQAYELEILSKKPVVKAITTADYPTPAKRPANSMLNCSKISAAFDIEMPDWRIALNELLLNLK